MDLVQKALEECWITLQELGEAFDRLSSEAAGFKQVAESVWVAGLFAPG